MTDRSASIRVKSAAVPSFDYAGTRPQPAAFRALGRRCIRMVRFFRASSAHGQSWRSSRFDRPASEIAPGFDETRTAVASTRRLPHSDWYFAQRVWLFLPHRRQAVFRSACHSDTARTGWQGACMLLFRALAKFLCVGAGKTDPR